MRHSLYELVFTPTIQFGAVKAVRLVTNKTGTSKGFAYIEVCEHKLLVGKHVTRVQMVTEQDAQNAIAKGNGMSVNVRCDISAATIFSIKCRIGP